MTPTELREVGEALYGPRWQSALARALGMGDRHMRKLAAGEVEISPGIAADIERLLARRRADDALAELDWLAATEGEMPVMIRLTQGRDRIGRKATALLAKALRERGIAVEIVAVPDDVSDPTERAAIAAAMPSRRD